MTNLAKRPPLGLKTKTQKKDKKHLDYIRSLPCCVCKAFGEVQLSPTTAHHTIHDRFGTHKRSDSLAIPLCEGHHQGLWDTSKLAIHKHPNRWKERYGADYNFLVGKIKNIFP
jgi:hypothetical protein